MQRVTNCILINDNHILLIKKPRRGWYAIPGGKMEQGETIKESVLREYWEETALHIDNPELAGVFTFNIFEQTEVIQEWMMFTFVSNKYTGELTDYCREGQLEWIPLHAVEALPMAEGDREIFRHLKSKGQILYGSFQYTADYKLLNQRFDPLAKGVMQVD